MSTLQGYVDRRVLLILQDGRTIVGVLAGYDQRSDIVLSESTERIYSIDEGVEEVPLGLYLVKGDQILLIGEIDEALDKAVDLSTPFKLLVIVLSQLVAAFTVKRVYWTLNAIQNEISRQHLFDNQPQYQESDGSSRLYYWASNSTTQHRKLPLRIPSFGLMSIALLLSI